MLHDDNDDDYVGVFGIGGGIELHTGGDIPLSDRGRWLCWQRRHLLCLDDVAFVVVAFVVVVSRPFSSGRVCVVALSLAHNGECW